MARTLGATPLRIHGQRLIEAGLVCGIALVFATLMARGFIDLMKTLVPYRIPRLAGVTVDPQAMGAGALLALVLALLFSGAPGLLGSAKTAALTRARVTRPSSGRLQSILIASQSALAVVVLVSALLLTRSFYALQNTDPGFRASSSLTLGLHGAGYDTDLILERVRALPGVRAAAVAYNHPFERTWEDGFSLVGASAAEGDSTSPRHDQALRSRLFRGGGHPTSGGAAPRPAGPRGGSPNGLGE